MIYSKIKQYNPGLYTIIFITAESLSLASIDFKKNYYLLSFTNEKNKDLNELELYSRMVSLMRIKEDYTVITMILICSTLFFKVFWPGINLNQNLKEKFILAKFTKNYIFLFLILQIVAIYIGAISHINFESEEDDSKSVIKTYVDLITGEVIYPFDNNFLDKFRIIFGWFIFQVKFFFVNFLLDFY